MKCLWLSPTVSSEGHGQLSFWAYTNFALLEILWNFLSDSWLMLVHYKEQWVLCLNLRHKFILFHGKKILSMVLSQNFTKYVAKCTKLMAHTALFLQVHIQFSQSD